MDEGGEAFPAENSRPAAAVVVVVAADLAAATLRAQCSDKSFHDHAGGGVKNKSRAGGGTRSASRRRRNRSIVRRATTRRKDGPARASTSGFDYQTTQSQSIRRKAVHRRTHALQRRWLYLESRGPNPVADSLNALSWRTRWTRDRSCRPRARRPCKFPFVQRGTGERKQITNTNYTHFAPSVSPDGKWAVAQRRRGSQYSIRLLRSASVIPQEVSVPNQARRRGPHQNDL